MHTVCGNRGIYRCSGVVCNGIGNNAFSRGVVRMKGIIIALLVLALYGCIAGMAVWYGYKAAALLGIALIEMGVLEGIA